MFGLTKPSLLLRITIAKSIGALAGLIGVIVIPLYYPAANWQFLLGILFWYTTLGALIGLGGVLNWHKVLNMPLPWWFRGALYGAFWNLLLVLLMPEKLSEITKAVDFMSLTSPWWFMLEGAIIGLIMDWTATRFASEGHECVEKKPA